MGQYYTPMIIDINNNIISVINTHDYGCGLKLMEHSYIGNSVVKRIERLITGAENKSRILWAGDYADDEPGERGNMDAKAKHAHKLPFDGNGTDVMEIRYLLNWDKKEAVFIPPFDRYTLTIHPLPLLTCEGNGRGGGDFRGDNEYVGAWARNELSIQDTLPNGFELIDPLFKED